MEELVIEGKTYLSSKRAAKVTGYAKDYIGQLCREGRVEAKLVGRSWYVYEPSLAEHRFNDERTKAKKSGEAPAAKPVEEVSLPIERVWEDPVYTSEPIETLPEIQPAADEATQQQAPNLSEMQSAWQEWFSSHETPRREGREFPMEKEEAYQPEPTRYEPPAEPVPMRTIVSDIEPMRSIRTSGPLKPALSTRSYRKEEPRKAGSPVLTKALLGGVIVIVVSITLIATGLIENLHLGGITETPVLEFFQGSQVIHK